jgi:hypothetical protein
MKSCRWEYDEGIEYSSGVVGVASVQQRYSCRSKASMKKM